MILNHTYVLIVLKIHLLWLLDDTDVEQFLNILTTWPY